MPKLRLTRNAWISAGALLSLGSLALSLLGGRRSSARISARVAGAFLEAWSDLRLEKKVARILAKAEGRDPAGMDPAQAASATAAELESLFSANTRSKQ
jgi:hypothetical protein